MAQVVRYEISNTLREVDHSLWAGLTCAKPPTYSSLYMYGGSTAKDAKIFPEFSQVSLLRQIKDFVLISF